jgi:hypothetical protein
MITSMMTFTICQVFYCGKNQTPYNIVTKFKIDYILIVGSFLITYAEKIQYNVKKIVRSWKNIQGYSK